MNLTSAEPFLILEVEVGTPFEMGQTGGTARRCIPITGGRVMGALEGRIIPGADWQTIHTGGDIEIEAHYAFRTDNGAVVEVLSNGVRTAPPNIQKKLLAGEPVDPSAYYFRTFVRLRTGAPELAHLNSRLFLSRGERRADRVRLDVFEVL